MPECLRCGHNAELADRFCPHCGSPLQPELPAGATPHDYAGGHYSGRPPQGAEDAAAAESKIIPIERIALLTVASYGFYLFYWYYKTWKQYRDHTGDRAYPVCHALTLLLPIYSWFRIYYHGKVARRLDEQAGRPDDILPILPVLLFIFANATISMFADAWDPGWPLPLGTLFGGLLFLGAYLAFHFFHMRHLQLAFNRYWSSIEPPQRQKPDKLRPGEIVFLGLGLLSWTFILLTLIFSLTGDGAPPPAEIDPEAVKLLFPARIPA